MKLYFRAVFNYMVTMQLKTTHGHRWTRIHPALWGRNQKRQKILTAEIAKNAESGRDEQQAFYFTSINKPFLKISVLVRPPGRSTATLVVRPVCAVAR